MDMGEVAIKTIKNRLFDFTNKSDKKNVTIKYNYYCNLVIKNENEVAEFNLK